MRFLKSTVLWLILYAGVITGVFFYVLFPSDLVLRQMEAAMSASMYHIKAGALRPSLPLGVKLKNVAVTPSQPSSDVLFHGESLDVQLNPFSLLMKYKTLYFSGNAYGGNFKGQAGFAELSRPDRPDIGQVSFSDIDLGRYGLNGPPFVRGISGKVRGSIGYGEAAGRTPAMGKLSLYLARGAYLLPEPFLGVNRIDFDKGEIQAQWNQSSLKLDKLELYGTQVNCFLTGDIQLGDRMELSRLNLKGIMEISGKDKIRMNVTVSGTLANPSFRYM